MGKTNILKYIKKYRCEISGFMAVLLILVGVLIRFCRLEYSDDVNIYFLSVPWPVFKIFLLILISAFTIYAVHRLSSRYIFLVIGILVGLYLIENSLFYMTWSSLWQMSDLK